MLTFIVTLLINIAIAYLLMPSMDLQNARAASLDEFDFPTAEDRPIPVTFGTNRIKAPNVLWYGNLKAEAITKKIPQGPFRSDKKQVMGHKYYVDMQLAVGFGGSGTVLKKIWEDEEVIFENRTPGNISRFAGDASNDDIFHGRFYFYDGSPGQKPSAVLEELMDESNLSAFRNLSYLVFSRAYIGKSTRSKAVSFEIERLSESPTGMRSRENIMGDANPAYIIYEILTNDDWGAQIPTHLIDIDSIEDAAKTFYDEKLGLSYIWSTPSSYIDVLKHIYNHCECRLRQNHKNGLLELYVVRNNYDVNQLLTLNKSNISSVLNYSKGSMDTINTEVRVKFRNRHAVYEERYVSSQNIGTLNNKRQRSSIDKDYTMFTRPELAQWAADRDIVPASTDIANCQIECNRDAQDLNIGDPVLVDLPRISRYPTVYRVTSIDMGTINSNRIQLDLVQDVFGLSLSLYEAQTGSTGNQYSTEPQNAKHVAITEIPKQLMGDGIAIFATPPAGLYWGYHVFERKGKYGSYDLMTSDIQGLNNHATLAENISTSATSFTLNTSGNLHIDAAKPEEIAGGKNIALIYYPDLGQQEFIAFQGYERDEEAGTYTLKSVQRGLLDTLKRSHTSGAQVLFLSGLNYTGLGIDGTGDAYYRLLTETQSGTLPFDAADEHKHVHIDRFTLPNVPSSVSAYKDYGSGKLQVNYTKRSNAHTSPVAAETSEDYVEIIVEDMSGNVVGQAIGDGTSHLVAVSVSNQEVKVSVRGSDQYGSQLSLQAISTSAQV